MFLNILCMGQSSTTKTSGPKCHWRQSRKTAIEGGKYGWLGRGEVVGGNGQNMNNNKKKKSKKKKKEKLP